MVFVVAAPPDAGLVPPFGSPVEPLIHAPEAIQPARVGGISMVDDTVFEHECAHARPLARECSDVGPGGGRDFGDGSLATFCQ